MKNILGIDLGTNSIGWAIRSLYEKKEQITNSAVLRFDKGVGEEKGNEFPKVKKRTLSRGRRRNYQAEKYRKFELLKFLIEKEMCPLTLEELDNWRKYRKGKKRMYPQAEKFINWLRFDFDGDGKPDFHLFNLNKHESHYVFRVYAVSEKEEHIRIFKTNPHVLGRIFYHLVQRRGFKGKDEEEAQTMIEGSTKLGIPGRGEIESYIERYGTLGAALYFYQKEKGGRIRARYNLRRDYEHELKEICKTQKLTNEDYKRLWKAIIWQRPLRTQKGLVGFCAFEKGKRRVALSHPLYQEFKTWVLINNLKIIPPNGTDKTRYLKEYIYPLFIRKSDFQIKHIVEQVTKDFAKMESNFTKTKEQKTKVVALSNFYDFKETLGEDWKEKFMFDDIFTHHSQPPKKSKTGAYTIEDIWHVLSTFDSSESLNSFATEKLGLDDEKAERFSKIKLIHGYATLSLSAVKKILPYLRKGYLYSHAIYLANLPKVLGVKELSEGLKSAFIDEIEPIKKRVEEIKSLNRVVNALITEHLNEDNRYFIEDDRELDASEVRKITEKLRLEFGQTNWDKLDEVIRAKIVKYVSEHFKNFLKRQITDTKDIFLKQPRLHQEIFKSLQEKYNLPEKNINYLWHPSEQEKYPNAEEYYEVKQGNIKRYISEKKIERYIMQNPVAEKTGWMVKLLGSPEPISKGFKNPMALKTLYRLKWLVNYLLQTSQIDEDTKIVVEMARDGKLNDSNKRAAIRRWQQNRKKENDEYKKKIEEINQVCGKNFSTEDKDLIKKLRLWEEQGKQCLYTGETINCCDVFNANKYDFEHTIPQKMSFDNELKNLTLANIHYNRNIKKKRIPYQIENYSESTWIEGIQYSAIKPRLIFIIKKIEKLEADIDEIAAKVKYVSVKEIKDIMIQNRHMMKLDLDYWKAKYQTFTLEEYKQNWRNNQLKDTQVITKYALPYLKTIFKSVTVQTGATVNKFKEIYGVKFSDEKKDRNNHSHHAIDAAILTLIPNDYFREKMLEKYHDAKDKKLSYSDVPREWKTFKSYFILNITETVLVNYLTDKRTLMPTYKKVRKRGKIRYIDKTKKPQMAKGDTIRGQLHAESFYGAIKQPKRDTDRKILFDEKGKMLLEDEIKTVIRRNLVYKKDSNSPGFKTLEELEKVIVNADLFQEIKGQISSKTFKDALEEGVWKLDNQGNKVNRIRRVRCFENKNIKFQNALQISEHSYSSKHTHKKFLLSKNAKGSIIYCLMYKDKKIKPIDLFEIYLHGIKSLDDIYLMSHFKRNDAPPDAILYLRQHFLFYKETIDELKDLNKTDLSKRLYLCNQFEKDGRIKFKHHLLSGKDDELKKKYSESSKMSFEEYTPLLRLSSRNFNFAIEGKDFEIMLDSKIQWLF